MMAVQIGTNIRRKKIAAKMTSQRRLENQRISHQTYRSEQPQTLEVQWTSAWTPRQF